MTGSAGVAAAAAWGLCPQHTQEAASDLFFTQQSGQFQSAAAASVFSLSFDAPRIIEGSEVFSLTRGLSILLSGLPNVNLGGVDVGLGDSLVILTGLAKL